jgi:hypothetical protein
MTAVAIATFKDSTPPKRGIFTVSSAKVANWGDKPAPSLPNNIKVDG